MQSSIIRLFAFRSSRIRILGNYFPPIYQAQRIQVQKRAFIDNSTFRKFGHQIVLGQSRVFRLVLLPASGIILSAVLVALPKKERVNMAGLNGRETSGSLNTNPEFALANYRAQTTCINDVIYSQIELNGILMKIIQTPQFQRLHYLKQTGGCYLVYPCAHHSRFEHSLGTCYLASNVMKRLREYQPELGITDRDILVVEMAALLHDLGHGPLSHTFDQYFMTMARPDANWEHETVSKLMFRHLLDKNPDVKALLDQHLVDEDYVFIEEAITPKDEPKNAPWPHQGRPMSKAFMYDIVSNKQNGFDVDKWDYTTRDAKYMKVKVNANWDRLLKNMRVLKVGSNARPTICYRDKTEQDLANLAGTRAYLHQSAYQHRTVKVIERMMVDALLIADQYLLTPGTDGAMLPISKCVDDMEAYLRLRDDVIQRINLTTTPEMKAARVILERIEKRDLYKSVGQTSITKPDKDAKFTPGTYEVMESEIASRLHVIQNQCLDIDEDRLKNSLAVIVSDVHGGLKNENPVAEVYFFRKNEYEKPYKKPTAAAPPDRKVTIRVFCRENDENLKKCVSSCFQDWCTLKGYQMPGEVTDSDDERREYASRPNSSLKMENVDGQRTPGPAVKVEDERERTPVDNKNVVRDIKQSL